MIAAIRGWLAMTAVVAAAAAADPMRPGVPAEVYVAPGRATTVLFHTAEKVASISLASPIITYKYDRALNQLEITPAVRRGGVETNLNLRIGAGVYVLLIKVVEDVRAQYLRDFTLAGDPASDEEVVLDRAAPMAPSEVDIAGAARTLEQAESDPVFRQAHPNLRIEPIRRDYGWNGGRIRLVEVAQFLDLDLLIFRLKCAEAGGGAGPDPRPYGLSVAGRNIPIIARYAAGAKTVYLAVQGYRLSRHNDWQLTLPPAAEAR
jgi:hypothetical protein